MPLRPSLVVPVALLAATGVCWAGTPAAASADDGVLEALRALPWLWGLLVAGAFFAFAAAGLLALAVGPAGRPRRQRDAIAQAAAANNFQEMWLICSRWPDTVLSRILQPALEQVGQGAEAVAQARRTQEQRERRRLTVLLAILGVAGVVAPGVLGWVAALRIPQLALREPAISPGRALTVAQGDAALFLGGAFAVAALALVAWLELGRRRREVLSAVGAEADAIFGSLPYEDLAGLRIGREFAAGNLQSDEGSKVAGRFRVSLALTSACPQCSAPINSSLRRCHECHAALEWQ